jgi:phage terminase Nu1 subunit (DNA packaging protein)
VAKSKVGQALAKHNRGVLINSGTEKLGAGKKLTAQEMAAIDAAAVEKEKLHDLPYMQRMPKHEFCKRFGGDFVTYINWRKRNGFPWGVRAEDGEGWDYDSDFVDALAALAWLRDYVARSHGGTRDPSAAEHPKLDRLATAKAEMAEMQLLVMKGELIHLDDAKKDQAHFAGVVRSFVEMLPREHQEIWSDMVQELAQGWRVKLDGGDKSSGASRTAKGSGAKQPTKAPAVSRGVRGKVRQARDRAV